jgi:hypothetical protein
MDQDNRAMICQEWNQVFVWYSALTIRSQHSNQNHASRMKHITHPGFMPASTAQIRKKRSSLADLSAAWSCHAFAPTSHIPPLIISYKKSLLQPLRGYRILSISSPTKIRQHDTFELWYHLPSSFSHSPVWLLYRRRTQCSIGISCSLRLAQGSTLSLTATWTARLHRLGALARAPGDSKLHDKTTRPSRMLSILEGAAILHIKNKCLNAVTGHW